MPIDVGGAILGSVVGQMLAIAWDRWRQARPSGDVVGLAHAVSKRVGTRLNPVVLGALLEDSDLLTALTLGDEAAGRAFCDGLLAACRSFVFDPGRLDAAMATALAASITDALFDEFNAAIPIEARISGRVLAELLQAKSEVSQIASEMSGIRRMTGELRTIALAYLRDNIAQQTASFGALEDERPRALLYCYLEHLLERHGRLPTWMRFRGRGSWTRARLAQPVSVRSHVDLDNALRRAPRPDGARMGAEEDRGSSWDDLRHTYRRAVVLGAPGSGKTWLAQSELRLAAERALETLDAGGSPGEIELPLYLRARDLASFHDDADLVDQVLRRALARVADLVGADLSDAIVKWLRDRVANLQRQFVVVDGLDELASQDLAGVRERLERLSDDPARRVLVTSRMTGFNGAGLVGDVLEVELRPFGQSERIAFVTAWFGDDEVSALSVRSRLDQVPLAEISRVPLLLAFLCILADDSPTALPHDIAAILAAVVRRMLERPWDRANALEPADARIDQRMDILACMAWRMAAAEVWRDELPFPEIRALIEEICDVTNWTVERSAIEGARADSELRELGEVLVGQGDVRAGISPTLAFLHRSIQEFLVGRYLARNIDGRAPDAVAFLRERWWVDADWYEVLPLVCAQSSDRTGLALSVANELPDTNGRTTIASVRALRGAGEVRAGAEDLIASCVQLLRSPSPAIRAKAARALADVGTDVLDAYLSDTSAIDVLAVGLERGSSIALELSARIASREPDDRRPVLAIRALAAHADAPTIRDALVAVASMAAPQVALIAGRVLLSRSDSRGVEILADLANSRVRRVRSAAVTALCGATALPGVLDALRKVAAEIRSASSLRLIAVALAQNGDARGIAMLRELAVDPDPSVRHSAASALLELSKDDGFEVLFALLNEPSFAVQLAAAELLARYHHPIGIRELCALAAATKGESNLRRAISVLATFGYEAEVRAVLANIAMSASDRHSRNRAIHVLVDEDVRRASTDDLRRLALLCRDSAVSLHAGIALAREGDSIGMNVISRLATSEGSPAGVREAASRYLTDRTGDELETLRTSAITSTRERERVLAAKRLRSLPHNPDVVAALRSVLIDSADESVRHIVARGLATSIGRADSSEALLAALAEYSDDPTLARVVGSALLETQPDVGVQALCELAESSDKATRRSAIQSLMRHTPRSPDDFRRLLAREPTPETYELLVRWIDSGWLVFREPDSRGAIRSLVERWDAWHREQLSNSSTLPPAERPSSGTGAPSA